MAICIDGNFVCLGGGYFCQTPTGVEFSGEALANEFCDIRSLQGSISGYATGGYCSLPSPPGNLDVIQKFPFSSDSNATNTAQLGCAQSAHGSHSSDTNGYTSGGRVPTSPPSGLSNCIQKFSFASEATNSVIGGLYTSVRCSAGLSSFVSGYNAGGGPPVFIDRIQKFPFISDTNGSDVGELTQCRGGTSGSSSCTNGYVGGGDDPSVGFLSCLEKFPFAADAPGTVIGSTSLTRTGMVGNHSEENGYFSGGCGVPASPTAQKTDMAKFPFASDTNGSFIGNLTCDLQMGAGSNSFTDGYIAGGGSDPGNTAIDIIHKFPFSTDTSASDVAELAKPASFTAGQQV